MVMDEHVSYGLKAKDLLRRQGYTVEDRWLTSREATDAFKAEHGIGKSGAAEEQQETHPMVATGPSRTRNAAPNSATRYSVREATRLRSYS
jgi:hypothetical protein